VHSRAPLGRVKPRWERLRNTSASTPSRARGLEWDRDKGALYNLAYSYFARMIREECDYTAMAARVLEAFREWLVKHPSILQY